MPNNCWYCGKDLDWTNDGEMVKNCPHCGVENDRDLSQTTIHPITETQPREGEMDLKNWSKENAKFIKIKDGESYEGVYKGCKQGVNMNGEPAVIYDFDGKEFKSSSTILADKFSTITEGAKVKLSRTGEGLQTKWTVETL